MGIELLFETILGLGILVTIFSFFFSQAFYIFLTVGLILIVFSILEIYLLRREWQPIMPQQILNQPQLQARPQPQPQPQTPADEKAKKKDKPIAKSAPKIKQIEPISEPMFEGSEEIATPRQGLFQKIIHPFIHPLLDLLEKKPKPKIFAEAQVSEKIEKIEKIEKSQQKAPLQQQQEKQPEKEQLTTTKQRLAESQQPHQPQQSQKPSLQTKKEQRDSWFRRLMRDKLRHEQFQPQEPEPQIETSFLKKEAQPEAKTEPQPQKFATAQKPLEIHPLELPQQKLEPITQPATQPITQPITPPVEPPGQLITGEAQPEAKNIDLQPLKLYVKEAMREKIPLQKIREAALASKWPPDLIDQALSGLSKVIFKKKLLILSALIIALIIESSVMYALDLFLIPYWLSTLKYAPTSVHISLIILLMLVIIFFTIKIRKTLKVKRVEYKVEEEKNVKEIKDMLKKYEGTFQTDIDKLYQLLMVKGALSLSEVAKGFGVSEEAAEEWGKILKDQDLIELHYPAVGEPELRWKK